MGFFGDLVDSVKDVFRDTVSSVGSTLGIHELDFNQQIEDAENEGRQRIKEERERLQAQLNSASAKERIAAEKHLAAIEESHKQEMVQLQREAIKASRESDADFEAKQASLLTAAKKTPTKPKFDRKKMLGLRDRAIRTPSVGPRPGQGAVIPRPTSTSGPRSGQAGARRPQ